MIENPELLKLAVKAIEAEPERWNQENWAIGLGRTDVEPFTAPRPSSRRPILDELRVIPLDMEHCGTTMCLAGHVVHQAGFQMLSFGEPGERRSVSSCLNADGTRCSIESKARELLGLDAEQASTLFNFITDDWPVFKAKITEVTGVEFE